MSHSVWGGDAGKDVYLQHMWKISVTSAQFLCGPKTALKIRSTEIKKTKKKLGHRHAHTRRTAGEDQTSTVRSHGATTS